MTRDEREHFSMLMAHLIGDIAACGGTPVDAAQLFAEAMRKKIGESVQHAALQAVDELFQPRRARRKR